MKKILFLVFCFLLLASVSQAEVFHVSTYCHVGRQGQILDRITFDVSDPSACSTLKADEFMLEAVYRYSNKDSWVLIPTSLSMENNTITLSFADELPVPWVDIGWWKVTSLRWGYSFSKAALEYSHTDVADEFVHHSMYRNDWSPTGEYFDYSLYSPAEADTPLPLILSLHDETDINILYSGRNAVAWAEPEFQRRHPCYVLVPYFEEVTTLEPDSVLDATVRKIREMAAEGLVDASRVYVTGFSMGGSLAFRLLTRYSPSPFFAAALLLSPRMDSSLSEAEIANAVSTPVRFLFSAADPDLPSEMECYDSLIAAGSTVCEKIQYSEEEFKAVGIEDPLAVDRLAYDISDNLEWVFEQKLNP